MFSVMIQGRIELRNVFTDFCHFVEIIKHKNYRID